MHAAARAFGSTKKPNDNGGSVMPLLSCWVTGLTVGRVELSTIFSTFPFTATNLNNQQITPFLIYDIKTLTTQGLVHTCMLTICTYLHQYAAFCYTSHYNEQVINDYDKLIRKAQAILHLEVTMKTHNHKTAQHTIVHACICRLLSIKLSFTTCIAAQA